MPDRLLTFFAWESLPADQQEIGQAYCMLAEALVLRYKASPERTVALRNLLDSMTAALRCEIDDESPL